MELVSDYMRDDFLRHGLNALTRETFGFDFEDWMNNGYFEGDYIPYSFLENGEILSNASANRMHFVQNGLRKDYIQIGTVMTRKDYRRRGLARKLVEQIIREYRDKCDGIYLFADLGALDFYRKIGFTQGLQYQYVLRKDCMNGPKKGFFFKPADGQNPQMKQKYRDVLRCCKVNASLEQINRFGLQMFYTSDLSDTYYAEDLDCFAVMELSDGTVTLKSVVCRNHLSLEDIIPRIALEYDCLKLGFSPCPEDVSLFESSPFDGEEDYRLFYLGDELKKIEKERLFFPALSHA